ncbi:MAG: hypothetical protein AAB350_01990 [Patescibacteria group bacterium]
MEEETPQNLGPKYPEGYENWPQEKKEDFLRGGQTENTPKIAETKEGSAKLDAVLAALGTEEEKKREKILSIANIKSGAAFMREVIQKFLNVSKSSLPFSNNSLPPRKGFEPSLVRESQAVEVEISKPDTAKEEIKGGEMFFDSSTMKCEIKPGDSLWALLKGALENNEQFKSMIPAQKTYILSAMTNKVLESPENYGLGGDGVLRVGDKIDFTKLFEDTKEIKSIFNKAKETIIEGGPQEKSILINNEKISEWVKVNPNEELTGDKLAEILNEKPKVEATIPEEFKEPEVPKPEIPKPEEAKINIDNKIIPEDMQVKETAGAAVAGGVGLAAMSVLERGKRKQMEKEIEEAKKRLQVLEGGNSQGSNLERSFASDSKLVQDKNKFGQAVEKAFRDEINNVYRERGPWGFGEIEGINTKKWGEMARLPANKVVEYYTGNSAQSGLPADIVEKLSNSKKHNALMRQTVGLMEQANGAVKPFEYENMEQFIKRLGGYVLKTYSQNLQKAA